MKTTADQHQSCARAEIIRLITPILITQRRENKLAEHREQLTLELSILSEKKSAKIIELLEELRRDLPNLRQRVDAEANDMAKPADPQAVLQAITEMHDAEREP